MKIWPSAPMFHSFTELIIEMPSPANIRGIALFSELLRLFTLPIDNLSIKEKTSKGFFSWINNIKDPTARAIKKPIKKE